MKEGMRGAGANLPSNPEALGIPMRPFLYTLDQISVLLHVDQEYLKKSGDYLYFEGRSTGSRRRDLMIARNIAPLNKSPEWRVAERELMRWLRYKGFKFYDRAVMTN